MRWEFRLGRSSRCSLARRRTSRPRSANTSVWNNPRAGRRFRALRLLHYMRKVLTMNCTGVKKHIAAYVDGELSESLANRVGGHLSECSQCRQEESALRETLGLLDVWEPVQPRLGYDAFVERVEQRSRVSASRVRQPLFPVPRWATAATLAVSIVVGGGIGMRAQSPVPAKPATQEDVAAAMDMQPLDDVVQASLVRSIEARQSSATGEGSAQ